MQRAMRWVGLVVLVVLMVATGLFAVSRAMGPSAAQREALSVLEADDPEPVGRNAFGALWLIEYDIPPQDIDTIVQADVENYRKALVEAKSHQVLSTQLSVAEGRFPRHAASPLDPPDCTRADVPCLAMVRERQGEYAERMARDRLLLERIRGLAMFGHYRSLMQGHTFPPFPPYPRLFMSHTASALDFAEGRTDAALTAVCRDVDTWRRLGPLGDSLMFLSIARSLVDAGARLFADMLAELPLDHPLPPICAVAFDPDHVTPDLCHAMRGEGRIVQAHMRMLGKEDASLQRRLLLDAEATYARMSPIYAHACMQDVRRALVDDTPIAPVPSPGSPWRLECVGNAWGCILSQVAAPAYDTYAYRVQDTQASLRAINALLHVRDGAARRGQTMQDAVREQGWPVETETWRMPVLEEAGDQIGIALRGQGEGAQWRIPLPGTRQARQGASVSDG